MHDERRIVLEDIDGAPVAVGREDQLVGAVVELLLVAIAQESEGVLGVVDLVEGEGIGSAEVDESQEPADDHRRHGPCPPEPAARGERREEARCRGGNRVATAARRRALRVGSDWRRHRPMLGTPQGGVVGTARMVV